MDEQALVDIAKRVDYCLNPHPPRGWHIQERCGGASVGIQTGACSRASERPFLLRVKTKLNPGLETPLAGVTQQRSPPTVRIRLLAWIVSTGVLGPNDELVRTAAS
jgi:hypothetical protein